MSANMMGAAAAGAVTMAAAVGGGMLCVSHGMCGGDQASQDASTPTKNVPPPKQSVPPPKQNVPPPKKRVSRMTKTSGLRQDRHGKIVGHGFRKGTEWDQIFKQLAATVKDTTGKALTKKEHATLIATLGQAYVDGSSPAEYLQSLAQEPEGPPPEIPPFDVTPDLRGDITAASSNEKDETIEQLGSEILRLQAELEQTKERLNLISSSEAQLREHVEQQLSVAQNQSTPNEAVAETATQVQGKGKGKGKGKAALPPPPPPPPLQSTPMAQCKNDRTSLMEQITSGVKDQLKKVQVKKGQHDLHDEIRRLGQSRLKPVSSPARKDSSSANEQKDVLVSALAVQLKAIRQAVHGSDSEDDSDDEWWTDSDDE